MEQPTEAQPPAETLPPQSQSVETPQETPAAPSKPIHSLIIDTGPLIKNDPPISTLLAQAEELYTLPSVIPEIKDEATRIRVQTQLMPFLTLRSPKPESIQFVTGFARRTGDLEVLSKPDLHLIALAYELECERNGGDWRLRKEPSQKRVNGKSPAQIAKDEAEAAEKTTSNAEETTTNDVEQEPAQDGASPEADAANTSAEDVPAENAVPEEAPSAQQPEQQAESWTEVPVKTPVVSQEAITHQLDTLTLEPEKEITPEQPQSDEHEVVEDEDDDEDEDGWITPSNLKKHQQKDQQSAPEQPIQRVLQVALLTSDYAMQNVLLRINLNLVSPSLARITRVKQWVLRCHGCFKITRIMSKQFCPNCGQPTLTRVSCSTDQNGNFQVHLKKNFQWNNRGAVYSVPKPVHGTSNGKYRGQGGGQNGWGRDLILAEDQKEYTQKTESDRRLRQRDLMDEDYLPGILTGYRSNGPGKARVGAGRNVNSKKRK
ncbi:20S-pre-rRNA D-site endonuclease NOB1 [Pestalotiopsis sp. NC0098]|nr:20S-pre-rRNA D-site endonuclease NOB1 [Pestalotiopsis sp. NC0098]